MTKVQTKTDNSFLLDKVILRKKILPNKNIITVLNCYAGDNEIWKIIENSTDNTFDITNIDIKEKKDNFYLQGKNEKFLQSLDLDKYDIIDLDAYGIPYNQMKIIFNKNYKGIVCITYIQSVIGALPTKLLNEFGYSNTMLKKCKTIFYKRGFEILQHFLAINNVKKITFKRHERKIYGIFTTY